ncbi:MAG: stage III sporulation protein AG [Hydrogeniiclostridium sp.]
MKKDESKNLFTKLAENPSARKGIVAVGILGILLIFLSGLFQNTDSDADTSVSSQDSAVNVAEYTDALQQKLQELLSKISGAEDASVMITLEKDAEQVYATEEKKSTKTDGETMDDDAQTNYILVKDSDGSQKALKITEVLPVVQGVVVICRGGDDPQLQQKITDAVTTALHISSARVCVIGSE